MKTAGERVKEVGRKTTRKSGSSVVFCVFFSSRRRHTRCSRDWSSDVCSSDLYFIQRSAGTGLSPMDCFLVSRGIKTLAVRMLQHNANGITVARHLDAHPKVRKEIGRASCRERV